MPSQGIHVHTGEPSRSHGDFDDDHDGNDVVVSVVVRSTGSSLILSLNRQNKERRLVRITTAISALVTSNKNNSEMIINTFVLIQKV